MTASEKVLPLPLRLLTHNIRYATSSPFTGERPWAERAPLVINQIRHETRSFTSRSRGGGPASFVCLQEVLHSQLLDILHGLNRLLPPSHPDAEPPRGPVWAHIGVGRDDGETQGEYSPILYPVDAFDLLHVETVWLSPTPNRPSKGWDAGSIRILTVGVFEHKLSQQRVIASNTHLDNSGARSRLESIAIILRTLRRIESEWGRDGQVGIFLAGDFNSFPTQAAYQAMESAGYLQDVHNVAGPEGRHGETMTFTGFRPDEDRHLQGRIDFVWLGPRGDTAKQWAVEQYSVLPNRFDAGVYLSDHRAVVGDVTLLC